MFDLYRAEDFIEQTELLLKLTKMENNIPTAEEFLNNFRFKSEEYIGNSDFEVMEEYARQFAKLHIEAALKTASEKAKWYNITTEISFEDMRDFDFKDTDYAGDPCIGYNIFIDKESILNAYPFENIK